MLADRNPHERFERMAGRKDDPVRAMDGLVLESAAMQELAHVLKPAIGMNSMEGVLATVRKTGMLTLLPDAVVKSMLRRKPGAGWSAPDPSDG